MKLTTFFISITMVFFIVILVIGYMAGEEYNGEETLILDYSSDSVWDLLTDLKGFENKKDVESVDITTRYLNLYAWEEKLDNGGFRNYRQTLKEDNKILEIELSGSSSKITGTWRFEIRESENKTYLKITEKSINPNIFIRGIMFYVARDIETRKWSNFIRSQLFGRLLTTP